MDERSKRIREAIDGKGISFAELEKITGVSKSALQRYATGQTKKIPIDVIEKIADATGVSARYLMAWDEKLKEKPPEPRLTEKQAEMIERIKNLTPDQVKQVKDYIEFLISQRDN